ncbi:DNA-binding transcriptional LysR family regulator [Luteibacter sp. 1214]|uniref:LysR family transcriptional regulator n=1 Tax=Luteibacter sp. 1214 TaxID=2817735 RepID=UPI002856300E|nr:LysR family transcriptional regulator [Luteibacter sp. 1214]MDR6642405.1 DNA-binding transcriptional LysR family regulator [Luteibacter sp. 1214]
MDRSDLTLERMRTFVRVAERGSLSAVARESGLGQSTVTRHLRELEAAVGAPLLSRTTRRMTLTDEGARFYASALQILRLVEKAADEVSDHRGANAGTVRLSTTSALGILHITPLIFAFQDRYPDIQVELGLTDERIDLVREGVDIAIRLGPLDNSSMKLRALGSSQRLLVASPAYLASRGTPASPDDLIGHDSIRMSNVIGSDVLLLDGPDGVRHAIPVTGRLRVDHGLAARAAVVAGRGIVSAHRWMVDDLLVTGTVVPVLPDHRPVAVPLNLLMVPGRSDVARVRRLIDYLVDAIATLPGIA